MQNTNGSSAVELVFVLMFFLVFVMVAQRFSVLASYAHNLSIGLQNGVEETMIDNGRPVCLEGLDPMSVRGRSNANIFGEVDVMKRLVFATGPICRGGN